MADLGLHQIRMIGVAKGVERKPGMEQLVFPGEEEPRRLPPDHPGAAPDPAGPRRGAPLRDHRPPRARAARRAPPRAWRRSSAVGPTRRQQLLEHFGGLQGVLAASVDDLARVEGISRTLAERIYQELH